MFKFFVDDPGSGIRCPFCPWIRDGKIIIRDKHPLIRNTEISTRAYIFHVKILAGVMELCTRGLGGSVSQLRSRGIQLGCVRTLVVVAEERPRISLCSSFAALFAPLGLSPRAVSTSFGCRQNIAICLQVRSCESGSGSELDRY
jgi:hypothetical protein